MKDEVADIADVATVRDALSRHGYLPDEGLATAVFLAVTLQRPLLLEGEAGVGKTEVAKVLAAWTGGELIRLGDPVVSPVRAEVSDDRWSLQGRGFGWDVEVEGLGDLGAAHVLPVPLPDERRNIAGAIEHLGATLRVVVRRRGREVWSGESHVAALEHGGIDRARTEIVRRGGSPDDTDARPERA